MSSKMFDGNDLPHELLLTTREKTKLRNAFNSNISTDLKLSKGATLLGNLLAGKGIVKAGSGNKKGKVIVRAGSGKQ